jgi:hypothetical protein
MPAYFERQSRIVGVNAVTAPEFFSWRSSIELA